MPTKQTAKDKKKIPRKNKQAEEVHAALKPKSADWLFLKGQRQGYPIYVVERKSSRSNRVHVLDLFIVEFDELKKLDVRELPEAKPGRRARPGIYRLRCMTFKPGKVMVQVLGEYLHDDPTHFECRII